jgi:hypothetical protein
MRAAPSVGREHAPVAILFVPQYPAAVIKIPLGRTTDGSDVGAH